MRAEFFFNETATTEIYTLSLHDALPISFSTGCASLFPLPHVIQAPTPCHYEMFLYLLVRSSAIFNVVQALRVARSEEHTSELQSRQYLVCRLLLEKKKANHKYHLLYQRH